MPFTPFHFGPHACIALALRNKPDAPAFIIANIFVDLEPLIVMLFHLDYPLHGFAHTCLGSAAIGSLWGCLAFLLRKHFARIMKTLALPYRPSLCGSILSGAFGALLHVLFDGPLYDDIQPFFPFETNPFFGAVSFESMYLFCTASFIPAVVLLVWLRGRDSK